MAEEIPNFDNLIDALDTLEKRNAEVGEMWHSMIRYLDVKARSNGIPLSGAFELTPLCNLDCKMCYAHLSRDQMSKCGKKSLNGSQWIDLIDQAYEKGLLFALFTGGEAMLHPDFDQIYLHALNKGLLLTVNTNGLLLTEERVEFFRQHPPKMIQMSLYGADEEEYEMVTGHRAFSKVIATIERLKKAELLFEVGMTPNRHMKDHGRSVLRLLDSLGVFFSMNTGLFQAREETGRAEEKHDLSLDEYIDLFKFRAELRGKKYIPVGQEEVCSVGGNCIEGSKGFRCAGGRSSFAIGWDGTLYPCLMVSEIRRSLLNMPFSRAWKEVHQEVMEYPFPQECSGCAYCSVCTVCVKQHAYGAPTGHASKALCERAKRLALEGMIQRN